jgi:copper(I)-binding protein
MKRTATLCLAALALALPALADPGALKIGHPWSRPTAPGAATAVVYLTVTNAGPTADRLIGGSTPVADKLELHETSMTGDVMRMRSVEGGLAIAPGQTLRLQPGGAHFMAIGLKRQLKPGDRLPVVLTFERAGKVDVTVAVEAAPSMMAPMAGMKMN